ncbi:MAG: thioredoxin-disulfide reductase [Alphaproteobacteria bacterium]|nr:thioredoxin-disulfide reductase [Alphaproteobacteria bacterium]
MSEYRTKLLIIGSGPAGYTAGIYAVRSGLSPLIVSGYQVGGQLTTTTDVENFPAFPEPINGTELMERMQKQCQNLGVEMVNDQIIEADFSKNPFLLKSEQHTYVAESVIISTGASAKKAGILGEEKFWGFGVSACATCDGFFYRGKDVAVVGGGNAAIVEALHLTHFAKSVTLIHRRDSLRAEKVMIERVLNNPKITVEWDSVVEEIYGEEQPRSVTGIKLRNVKTKQAKDIKLDGVFIAIGHQPNTDLFKAQLALDEQGYILTQNNTKTSVAGVFAAGDVTNPKYKQAVIAASMGCEAALDAETYLNNK